MSSSATPDNCPFAAEGGPAAPPVRGDRDPYRTLDELMAVVEALCPVWPPRPPMRTDGPMLL